MLDVEYQTQWRISVDCILFAGAGLPSIERQSSLELKC